MTLHSTLVLFFVFSAFNYSAQAQPIYCPNTVTDTDGDGWGYENGESCIVVEAEANTPICGMDAIDSDGDGWGWDSGFSCLVDNVVHSNSVVGGEIVAEPGKMPNVRLFETTGYNELRYATVSSQGIIYGHRPGFNLLTSMDENGNILWEVEIDGSNSVDIVQLNNTEEYLILKMAAGQVSSYTIDGAYRWSTNTFELIKRIEVTENSVILHREGWGNGAPEWDYASIISLDHNGQRNWEFKPIGFLDHFEAGNDDRIYVTVSNGRGNETVHIFEE